MWGWAGEKKKPFESPATVWLFIEPCPSEKESLAYSVFMACHGMESFGGLEDVSHRDEGRELENEACLQKSLHGPPGTSTREDGAVSQADNTARSPISLHNPNCLSSSHLTWPPS